LIRKWLKAEYSKKDRHGKRGGYASGRDSVAPAGQCLLALRVRPLGAAVAETPRPRDMIVVRFADDSVLGFEYEADAKRFLADMRARSEVFSLTLHPEKTRIIRFGRYAALNRRERGQGKPETFTFLGFTMICGQKRMGGFQLQRRTRRDRMQTTIQRVKENCSAGGTSRFRNRGNGWDRWSGLLCIPRGADELSVPGGVPSPYCSTLEACADAPQPACTTNLEADAEAHRRLAAKTTHSASLA